MSRLIPMSDLVADDLMLDRLAARDRAGAEPVAGLLAALAEHADTPLPELPARRRRGSKHRYLGPLAALVVAASGAGVAAAVTLPHRGVDEAQKARVVKEMDQAAHSDAPSALLSRLGLPQAAGVADARGLVLARGSDGRIVLVPAAALAAQDRDATDADPVTDGPLPGALPQTRAANDGGSGDAVRVDAAGATAESTDDPNGSRGPATAADESHVDSARTRSGDGQDAGAQQSGTSASSSPAGAGTTGTPLAGSTPKKPGTAGTTVKRPTSGPRPAPSASSTTASANPSSTSSTTSTTSSTTSSLESLAAATTMTTTSTTTAGTTSHAPAGSRSGAVSTRPTASRTATSR